MGEPLREPQEKEKPTVGQIIAGILLTILAIPFLLMAACMPALLAAQVTNFYIGEAVLVLGVLGFAAWRAYVTDNPGVRWTIIVAIVAAVIAAALILIPNPSAVAFWR